MDLTLPAKTKDEKFPDYPTVFHCLDVGKCAVYYWDNFVGKYTKQKILSAFGMSNRKFRKAIGFICSLHDIGKITPQFVFKRLGMDANLFPQYQVHETYLHELNNERTGIFHPEASQYIFLKHTDLPKQIAKELSVVISYHHGSPTYPKCDGYKRLFKEESLQWLRWRQEQDELYFYLRDYWGVNGRLYKNIKDKWALLFIAKIMVIADWVASGHIPRNTQTMEEYQDNSPQYVRQAFRECGFVLPKFNRQVLSFGSLLSPGDIPRSFQTEIKDILANIKNVRLAIVEAPPGCGKTEVSQWAASYFMAAGNDGVTLSMPTCATTASMYARTLAFANAIGDYVPDQAHGNAPSYDRDRELSRWMGNSNRRRMAASPFTVCTVDQLLYGVIQSKFCFMRMPFNHCVILDEIHAYDVYTSSIIDKCIRWLLACGCNVVLLSATLPRKRREDLLHLVHPYAKVKDVPYPRISVATSSRTWVHSLTYHEQKTIDYEFVDKMSYLGILKDVECGGCGSVLVNTVGRSQSVYLDIAAHADDETLVVLIHSNMPRANSGKFNSRREVEKQINDYVGRRGHRPKKLVVVATPVLEQSLDIDFDVMYTDLCPIDLIIQRSGRLHRHVLSRPLGLQNPKLVIMHEMEGIPEYLSDKFIYKPFVLNATYHVLANREHKFSIPQDADDLVNSVYESSDADIVAKYDLSSEWAQELADNYKSITMRNYNDNMLSLSTQIPDPYEMDLFDSIRDEYDADESEGEFDESCALGYNRQAVSRKATVPSYDVLFLKRMPNGKWQLPNGEVLIEPVDGKFAQEEMIKECSAPIRSYALRAEFDRHKESPWGKIDILPFRTKDWLYVVINGAVDYRLDTTLGVVVRKVKK